MPYFDYDKTDPNNPYYKLETSPEDKEFNIKIPAYDRERVFLGDIKIKTHFKEYTLTSSVSKQINIISVANFETNREVATIPRQTDSYSINTSNKGMLLNNNNTYTTTFVVNVPWQSITSNIRRGIKMADWNDTNDPPLVNIQLNYNYYDCKASPGELYAYINAGNANAIFQVNGAGTYYLKSGGCLWSEYREEYDAVRWYYRENLSSSSTLLPSGDIRISSTPSSSTKLYQIHATYNSINS